MWNTELIISNFLDNEAKIILSIPLPKNGGIDKLVWHYNRNGSSVKSGYWVAVKERGRKNDEASGSLSGSDSRIFKG